MSEGTILKPCVLHKAHGTQSAWYDSLVLTLCLKYRLFPSNEQERKLSDALETCRQVYNSLVNDRVFQYETAKHSPSRYEQQTMFPKWSKDFPEVNAVHSQVLQNVAVRVDLAFRAFFQRAKEGKTPGFPRLKGKGQYDSITYPQSGFWEAASSGRTARQIFIGGSGKTATLRGGG